MMYTVLSDDLLCSIHSGWTIQKKYDRRSQLRDLQNGQTVVAIDPRYFRPTEVDSLLGDPTRARKKLGWKQEISFDQMVREMIEHDLKEGMREAIWKQKESFAQPIKRSLIMHY